VNVDGLAMFNTPYEDMTVNSYLVFDPKGRQAAAFDTGSTVAGMLEFAAERQLKIESIFITHSHADHIADLRKLEAVTDAEAYIGENERFHGPQQFAPGRIFALGGLKVETRQTSGHARGGITYVITGLVRRLAVVGDALFAASMGGGAVSYEEALRTNRKEIFSLPDDTVICPGHGPLTTVGEQKSTTRFSRSFRIGEMTAFRVVALPWNEFKPPRRYAWTRGEPRIRLRRIACRHQAQPTPGLLEFQRPANGLANLFKDAGFESPSSIRQFVMFH